MKIEEKAAAMVERSEALVLSSVTSEGYPRSCMMSRAGNEGLGVIYFATGASSLKTYQFKENPKAGVCCSEGGDSVTLIGEVTIFDDSETKRKFWQDWFIEHFPGGPDDPDYCVLRFDASSATLWIDGEFVDGRLEDGGFKKSYRFCQSCGMPLSSDDMRGSEADGSVSGKYCVYCRKDGKFTFDCTMDEMIEQCVPHMTAAHPEISADAARGMMRGMFPSLVRWRGSE
ncbi:MAG: zinc ribbon domain-containing protein [Synergistaceae bacterium]|nr:zinc ribbon domain-containing protein [Synergistaceae bacterium]